MAKRIMDPAWLESPQFRKLDPVAESVMHRMFQRADDLGRLPSSTLLLQSLLFPLGDGPAEIALTHAVDLLEERDIVRRYPAEQPVAIQLMVWRQAGGTRKSKFPHPSAEITAAMAGAPEKKKPEPSMLPAVNDEVVLWMPYIGNRQLPICESMVREWRDAFPAVDVVGQLRQMRAWCLANTENQKTWQGLPRFIFRWLAKEQDRAAPRGPERSKQQHTGMLSAKAALYGNV